MRTPIGGSYVSAAAAVDLFNAAAASAIRLPVPQPEEG